MKFMIRKFKIVVEDYFYWRYKIRMRLILDIHHKLKKKTVEFISNEFFFSYEMDNRKRKLDSRYNTQKNYKKVMCV